MTPCSWHCATMRRGLRVERLHGKSDGDFVDDALTQKTGEVFQVADNRLAVLSKFSVSNPFFDLQNRQLVAQFGPAFNSMGKFHCA